MFTICLKSNSWRVQSDQPDVNNNTAILGLLVLLEVGPMAAVNVPCVQPFDVEMGDSQAALGPKWDKSLLRFENYMTVIAIQDDVQRKVLLLHAVGGGGTLSTFS